MTRTAILTALALTISAPAFANPIADSLGVDAGDYTLSQLIRLQNAYENDDHTTVRFILSGAAAEAAPVAAGAAFAVAQAEQDDEVSRANFLRAGGSEVVSTQSFGGSNAGLLFAIEQAEQDDETIRANFLRSMLN